MATLSTSVDGVYEGIWTDWSRGRLQGLTWTLSPTNGTLLTNSLALFVTLAGSQLWIIMRFAIHQLRSHRLRASHTDADVTEDHLQQRVVLRNAATDFNTMLLMIELAWKGRNAARPLSFPLLIASIAISHYILFLLAGAFSSQLVSAGTTVLARSHHCGVWNETYYDTVGGINFGESSLDTLELKLRYSNKVDNDILLSQDYARECYQTLSRQNTSSTCTVLIKSHLNFTQNDDEACPFKPQVCHTNSKSVVFDTGFIDSHHDLGINAPPSDRLSYRRLTTCAVLNHTGYVFDVPDGGNGTDSTSALTTTYAYYGPRVATDENYTYSYANPALFNTNYTAETTIPYLINTQMTYAASPSPYDYDTFDPIPEIRQASADLVLFFLSYIGRYFGPVDDPWFSAHQFHLEKTRLPFARRQYTSDSVVSGLGCAEQHQICSIKDGSCTPLLGWVQTQNVSSFTETLTPHQKITFDHIIDALWISTIGQVTSSLASNRSPVKASELTMAKDYFMSIPLPDNQWQIELANWHAISLAMFQRLIMQWATGDMVPEPESRSQLIPPQTDADTWFCQNMKIRSSQHQSFKVVPLFLILITGAVVIALSWNIEDVTAWIQYRLRYYKGLAMRELWDEDDMLRLKGGTIRGSWRPRPHSAPSSLSDGSLEPLEKSITVAPPPYVGAVKTQVVNSKPTISPSRLWSELPPEPQRDFSRSTTFDDVDLEKAADSEVFGSRRTGRGEINIPSRSHIEGLPELANPQAQVLAKIYGRWI